MASTGTARSVGALLCSAACRVAVAGGLTLLAWMLGSAVANAATTSSGTTPPAVSQPAANTVQSEEPGLIARLLDGLLGHTILGGDSGSSAQDPGVKNPPTNTGSSSGDNPVILPSPIINNGGSGGTSGNGVWTGTTTVTVPAKPTPPVVASPPPPAPPVHAPVIQQPVQDSHPVVQQVAEQAAKPVITSMSGPTGDPDQPQRPIDEPLQQQPASQPISSPASGSGLTGHDAGGNSGIAGVVPPQTGFQPTPGSSTDEHNAKRVTEGVPGLPSTSPD